MGQISASDRQSIPPTPSREHFTSANIGCSDQTYLLFFLSCLMMRAGALFPHQRRCS